MRLLSLRGSGASSGGGLALGGSCQVRDVPLPNQRGKKDPHSASRCWRGLLSWQGGFPPQYLEVRRADGRDTADCWPGWHPKCVSSSVSFRKGPCVWRSPRHWWWGLRLVGRRLESLLLLFPLWVLCTCPPLPPCPARPLLWGGQKGVSKPHLPTGTGAGSRIPEVPCLPFCPSAVSPVQYKGRSC